MENNNDSLSVSSLRDRRTGLDPDSSGAGCTPQLEFGAAANRRIPLLEVPQANFSKGKNQPDDNRRTKWSKKMNKLVMQCNFKSYPSKRNSRKRIHVLWNEIGGFELIEQKLFGQERATRTNKWLSGLELEQLQREIRSEERKQSQQRYISEEKPEATVNEDRGEDTGEQRHEALIERRAEFNEEVEELSKESIEQPPNLRGIDRRRLKCASEKVDRVLQHVTLRMETLKQLNNILKAVGKKGVAGLVGEKEKSR